MTIFLTENNGYFYDYADSPHAYFSIKELRLTFTLYSKSRIGVHEYRSNLIHESHVF